jgi:hypothetical protein
MIMVVYGAAPHVAVRPRNGERALPDRMVRIDGERGMTGEPDPRARDR